MNIYEIHFLMLVLGVLAGLFVAGRFRRASKRRNPYKKKVRLWPIGLATTLVVALSPFSRFIPSLPFDLHLLTQSLLFSALGLFIIMFLDTIIKSFRTRDEKPHYRPNAGVADTSSVQRQAYHDTEAPGQTQVSQIQTAESQAVQSQAVPSQHDAVTVDKSAVKAELTDKTPEAEVNELQKLADEFEARPEPVEEIDLAEQAEQMDSIRNQLSDDVVLPSTNSWQETQTELDLTQDVMPNDNATVSNKETSIAASVIEDAEVVAEENVNEFRNDITGDYNSPSHGSYSSSLAADPVSATTDVVDAFSADMPEIPETLQDALNVSKASTEKLKTKIDTLDSNLRQLTKLQTSTAEAAESRAQQMLEKKQALVQSQDETRAAAESVIEVQTALLQRARKQHELVAKKLEQERKELAAQRVEILRTRAVAQKAALLARKASLAQQATRDIAKREQSARLASQEKARKAVLIARNAISALAEEERKRGLTRH